MMIPLHKLVIRHLRRNLYIHFIRTGKGYAMTNETELRFRFVIENRESGEQVTSDWATFTPSQIDLYGAVETIDIHTGAALRALRRQASRETLSAITTQKG